MSTARVPEPAQTFRAPEPQRGGLPWRARQLNLDGVAAYESELASEAAMSEGTPHLIVERGEAEDLPALMVLQGAADDLVPLPHTFVQRRPDHPESNRAVATMIV